MNRILYLEGSSGISGDMTVSALLDLGASKTFMEDEIKKLPLEGYRLLVGRTSKNGIDACAFYVELDENSPQPLRDYRQIREMLCRSPLDDTVREVSLRIFTVLAQAEAKVHGTTMEKVHFHEVGAVDSIIDIVGAAACFVNLGISQNRSGNFHGGNRDSLVSAWKNSRSCTCYGRVSQYLWSFRAVYPGERGNDHAYGGLLAAAMRNRELPEKFTIEKIGIGSGEKDFPHANILRAMILQEKEETSVMVLETNVDDCTGEQLGYLQEILLEAGALDAVFRPVLMKKSRPAYQLQVVCKKEKTEELEKMIFRETTTIGIRRYPAERTVLERKILSLKMPEGIVRVKVCRMEQETFWYPEYEDVKQYCQKTGKPFMEIHKEVQDKAREEFEVKR